MLCEIVPPLENDRIKKYEPLQKNYIKNVKNSWKIFAVEKSFKIIGIFYETLLMILMILYWK